MKKLILLLPFLLSSCATMFSGQGDTISINANDKEASIIVDNQFIGKGKIQYTVPKDRSVVITVNKNGCHSQTIQSTKSFNAMTLLNLFFWPGFIVDAATGTIQKTNPTYYNFNLICDSDN